MVHPKYGRHLFYDKAKAEWVEKDYTIWPIAEWEGTFGSGKMAKASEHEYVDTEGRHWETFGYVINLYDDDAKT